MIVDLDWSDLYQDWFHLTKFLMVSPLIAKQIHPPRMQIFVYETEIGAGDPDLLAQHLQINNKISKFCKHKQVKRTHTHI